MATAFETATGRIYEDFGKHNVTHATIEPHEQLMWMHDQNFTPLSSAMLTSTRPSRRCTG